MTGPRETRNGVVALNADVVGYSRLLADDLDATSKAMAAARDVVDQGVKARGGRVVNFVGDNFMAVFDTTQAGVQAPIEIASTLEEANADVPSPRWLHMGVGTDLTTARLMADCGPLRGALRQGR